MCGIGGVVGDAPEHEVRATLAAMTPRLAHRGPDDAGRVVLGSPPLSAGLCATRLAIRDLGPNGHQPMTSARTGNVIAFNGEIYNTGELRAALGRRGITLAGHCDTEVVLACYDCWGVQCVERLRGMFALAVWDASGRRLFLARDRLGIKPLYYRSMRGGLAFASELRALMAADPGATELDVAGIASYLLLGGIEEPHTVLASVRTLPAGHAALFSDGGLSTWCYWSLRAAFADNGARPYAGSVGPELRERLEDAVSSHRVSDVPLGVFLSGGIDSSALVALSASIGNAPRTVSLVFRERSFSEAEYIRAIVSRYGTEHVEVEVSLEDALRQLPSALSAMDQPTVDGINSYLVSDAAVRSGLTVALSGLGGDELFAGYDSFRRVAGLERLRRVIPPATAPLVGAVASRAISSEAGDKLERWLAQRDAPASAHELLRELFSPAARHALLGGGYIDSDEQAKARTVGELPRDRINAVSCLELERYTKNVLLRDTDVMSMARGLEVRVPFLDDRLVSWVGALSGAVKTAGRGPKPLLIDALDGLLPSKVVRRPKMGFTLPFAPWMRGSLRSPVETVLLDPAHGGRVADVLAPEAVAAVWHGFLQGRIPWSRPWAIYVLKEWGERNVPG